MRVAELASTIRDAITVSRVFAEPSEKDGVTVIAAATVVGGAGGGGGHDERGQEGEGGGFGVAARPAGAFVIKDGRGAVASGGRRQPACRHPRCRRYRPPVHSCTYREGTRNGGQQPAWSTLT
jgi:hypothetical protein